MKCLSGQSTLLDEMEFSEQRLAFEVESVQNQERNFLTCDENLLREMAEASGGNFLRQEKNFMNSRMPCDQLVQVESL